MFLSKNGKIFISENNILPVRYCKVSCFIEDFLGLLDGKEEVSGKFVDYRSSNVTSSYQLNVGVFELFWKPSLDLKNDSGTKISKENM